MSYSPISTIIYNAAFTGALGGTTGTNQSTGTSYASGVWTDGVSLTAANIDTNAGLQDPKTGARYCNTV